MRPVTSSVLSVLAAGLLVLAAPGPSAAAEIQPSSKLLVPWFEVDLNEPAMGLTTLFAVCNHDPGAIEVLATVHTNWGIPVLKASLTLQGGALRTVNLRDWLVRGALPDRTLAAGELAHVQAALSGRPSPGNGLYYGTPAGSGMAVGYVTLSTMGGRLWGDYYEVDGPRATFLAGPLVDLDPAGGGALAACERHAVRFLNSQAVARGTQLLVWTGWQGAPSPTPQPEHSPLAAGIEVYDEPGSHVEDRALGLLSVDVVEVDDLSLQPEFGWLEIETEEPSFITQHVHAPSGGAALQAWCLPLEAGQPVPLPAASLAIEAMVQGFEADFPPGPELSIDTRYLQFTYVVENTGEVLLADVVVTDSQWLGIGCPKTWLAPGESMTCHSIGAAIVIPGQYHAVGTVTGQPPWGDPVSAEDPIYYYGRGPSLSLVKLTNGEDADTPPGPSIPVGAPVTWQYLVTNTGPRSLIVEVTDDQGVAVTCPSGYLPAYETMICTGSGTAQAGQYVNVGTAIGRMSPWPVTVAASDVSHYFGVPE